MLKFIFLCIQFTYASEVAITLDDFNYDNNKIISSEKRDILILETLKQHKIQEGAFVTTKYLKDEKTKSLLKKWSDEKHLIANHTHNHSNYHKESFEKFSSDIMVVDKILSKYESYQKFFRFPYLKEGESEEKRDKLRAFLASNNFFNGGVSIDASEAFKDELYKSSPQNIPAGEGIVWALAKESKQLELRYPAESDQYEKDEMDLLRL